MHSEPNDVKATDAKTNTHTPAAGLSRPALVTIVVVVGIVIAAAAGFIGALMATGFSQTNGSNLSQFKQVKGDGNQVVTKGEQDISAVADKVSPSVVSIITTNTQSSPFSSRGYAYEAAGTGMVVSKNGYIMTNKHVVQDATKASVVMSDGKTYNDVEVVGVDPLNDVAFLKISNVNNLNPVQLGDSKTIRVGQTVIAIGNALGQYQNTVTTGIVSGLGRPVIASSNGTREGAESLNDLIQTDAAINQGNSGGPLLNSSGQVIGMNTAVASDAQSIGFAIPIGAVKGMIEHLVETGKLSRALVGVQYVSIDPEVKSRYKLSVSTGDLITEVNGGSPAAKAGLKKSDVITKVNGQNVEPGKSISTLVGEFKPGDSVQLTILRGSTTSTKSVTLQAYGR